MTTPRPGRKEHSYTSAPHGVTHERFDDENEDRFELAGNAGYATAIDQGPRVWILELWVNPEHRGQGGATALLEAVIAHYAGRVLALSAEPITMTNHEPAGPSADQLAAWYTRHGFQRDGGHRMTRLPGDHRASVAGDPAAPKVAATSASGHMTDHASSSAERAPGPDSPSAHETPLPAEAAPTAGPQQAGEEPFTYHHTEYDGGVHWFSAEHDGEEIAHAHVLEKQEPGGQHIEIRTLWTNPYYRRKGIGSQLIEEVANHFPGLEMRLKPYPIDEDGTQTTEDIEEFYAGRGFDRYQLRGGDPFELSDYMTKPAFSVPTAARERHDVEVRKARREPDKDFVRSHRAAAEWLSPAQEREHRFAAADLLARHGIHVRSDGPLSSEDVDTSPDLDHTIEVHPGQPLYTEQDDLNRDVLAHYRQHGPGVPHPPTWQADHDDPDLPHRPTVVTYRGRHWVTDGLHRTLVARERGQSITAWHVDPERDRREYEQWAARRQRQAASGPAEFPDPVQPAARFSASAGQATGGHRDRLTRRSGPSRRPARRPAGPGGSQQRGRTGCSCRYRELREVPATDQAIRAARSPEAARP